MFSDKENFLTYIFFFLDSLKAVTKSNFNNFESAHAAVRQYFSGPEAKVVVDIASMSSSDFELGVNGDPDVDLDAHNYQVRVLFASEFLLKISLFVPILSIQMCLHMTHHRHVLGQTSERKYQVQANVTQFSNRSATINKYYEGLVTVNHFWWSWS